MDKYQSAQIAADDGILWGTPASFPPEAESPVLVAFRDDTLQQVLAKVARLGGAVHVIVPTMDTVGGPWQIAIAQIRQGAATKDPVSLDEDDCRVTDSSHLGLLLDLMELHGRTMTIHISRQESTVQLVDIGTDLVLA
ncbi:hypothetical protein JOL79_05395 [Microbispora sp. RL4-1S]|uniref:Uncharacterized protein n=1 Tax=Microbispora oryzae TaxID=2806554 RepID=A0A940WCY9_9ACTN|nr:hypothetical protein [Microbispora oryzae]MBP2703234.1 hypothetical protein [Microbispora oryzae]